MRWHVAGLLILISAAIPIIGVAQGADFVDSDQDGISDAVEQALLEQFTPRFWVGQTDCAALPAEFLLNAAAPTAMAENGTVYGQVLAAKRPDALEIHFYHLWKADCGAHPHALDAEHVSVLVAKSTGKAIYWYAAAHENTVCDVSQIAGASVLNAEEHGPEVWISPDKHASYLSPQMCGRGCGADRCVRMKAAPRGKVVNLGEPGHPMNGSAFITSKAWPLMEKMSRTDFPAASVARVDEMPNGIVWFRGGRHPAQGVIAISSSTEEAIAGSGRDTAAALSTAQDSTGNALQNSYASVTRALGKSAKHTSSALRSARRATASGLKLGD